MPPLMTATYNVKLPGEPSFGQIESIEDEAAAVKHINEKRRQK
jgi:hypothetical protein